ncbi:hypothetical protein niasHT_000302 [Heterodera trifolii]|uniref:DUF7153 domain-containing protein n=1 Tax=Heterodera trifolii TaxID=157864 RepID=A0ABD2LTG3_9BILA
MGKKNCRRFLLLTISNSGQFERNWPHSPLVYEEGLCRAFSECNLLTLRRWKSVRTFGIDDQSDLTKHKFADLAFFDLKDSPAGEMPTQFMDENQGKLDEQFNCHEKGLYEELNTVKWEGRTTEESDRSDQTMSEESSDQSDQTDDECTTSNWDQNVTIGEQNEEERLSENSAFILVGYPSNECHWTVGQFISDWRSWSSVRALCGTLPPKCAFRRLSLFRKNFGKCRFAFLLLVQVDNALSFVQPISNCLNNSLSLPLSPIGIFVALFEEIEFEIGLEVIQHLVETSKSIICVGNRLVIRFGDENSASTGPFSNEQTPLSLYRKGNFCPSSMSPSFSSDLTNGNYSDNGEMSEFDVQMEEIMAKDENQNKTAAHQKGEKAEGKAAEDAANNNNNKDRSSSRKRRNCGGEKRNDRRRRRESGDDGTGIGKAATRQKGGFSLLRGQIGTLWRRISTKY